MVVVKRVQARSRNQKLAHPPSRSSPWSRDWYIYYFSNPTFESALFPSQHASAKMARAMATALRGLLTLSFISTLFRSIWTKMKLHYLLNHCASWFECVLIQTMIYFGCELHLKFRVDSKGKLLCNQLGFDLGNVLIRFWTIWGCIFMHRLESIFS